MNYQTITLEGRAYVVVPADDFSRLTGSASATAQMPMPDLPQRDASGRLDAVAYARASIAREIITRMNNAGMTQAQLSLRAGVPRETLNRILKCLRTPDEKTVAKIDKALKPKRTKLRGD
jgi:lambda repressor-like predicted transcriptional regulator